MGRGVAWYYYVTNDREYDSKHIYLVQQDHTSLNLEDCS